MNTMLSQKTLLAFAIIECCFQVVLCDLFLFPPNNDHDSDAEIEDYNIQSNHKCQDNRLEVTWLLHNYRSFVDQLTSRINNMVIICCIIGKKINSGLM